MKAAKEHKLYWSESALVSYESSTRLASILYDCGAFYVGEVDKGLRREGTGLFFLPFCGFLFGRFAADRAEGSCLLKEGDGTCGVYAFSDGVQHGPALRWDSATGEMQHEVYSSGVFRRALCAARGPEAAEPPEELSGMLALAAEFRAKVESSPLFGIITTDRLFALGALRGGKLHGVGIRFGEGCSVERGVFVDGRPRGCCQRLAGGTSCVFAFFGDGDSEQGELAYCVAARRWELRGGPASRQVIATPEALRLIGERFVRTGLALPGAAQRVPFRADPNALLFNARLAERKRAQLADWSAFFPAEATRGDFEGWVEELLAPLGLLAEPPSLAPPSTLRGRPPTAKASCETRKLDRQRNASTSRLMMCSTARLFREDVLAAGDERPMKRCSSRVLEKAAPEALGGGFRPNLSVLRGPRRPVLDLKGVGFSLRSLAADLKAGSPASFTQRYEKRAHAGGEKVYRLESSLRKGTAHSSLDTATARTDSLPGLQSPPALCRQSPPGTNKKSQTTEQTIDESIDFSGAERPRAPSSSQFLSFHKYGSFKKPAKAPDPRAAGR